MPNLPQPHRDVPPPPRPIPRPVTVVPQSTPDVSDAFVPRRPLPFSARFRALALLICLCGAGYLLTKHWPSLNSHNEMAAVVPPAEISRPSTTIPMSEAEDLLRHLESALAGNLQASGEIKRSQELANLVVGPVKANYMQTETRRLQAAVVAGEKARRHVEQARGELEIAKNLLLERSMHK